MADVIKFMDDTKMTYDQNYSEDQRMIWDLQAKFTKLSSDTQFDDFCKKLFKDPCVCNLCKRLSGRDSDWVAVNLGCEVSTAIFKYFTVLYDYESDDFVKTFDELTGRQIHPLILKSP